MFKMIALCQVEYLSVWPHQYSEVCQVITFTSSHVTIDFGCVAALRGP